MERWREVKWDEVKWDGVGRCAMVWERGEVRWGRVGERRDGRGWDGMDRGGVGCSQSASTLCHGFSDKPPNPPRGDFVGEQSSQPPFPFLTTEKQTDP